MSETKLVVRDLTRDISMTCHGSDAHRVVAALSADPVTIEELETAIERFMHVEPQGFFHRAPDILDDEPWDSGLVVVDLAARLVVIDSTYFSTSHSGQVFYQNGEFSTNISVGYSLADEWQISDRCGDWQNVAEARRRERAEKTCLDARGVLYGRPLLEFLATACWSDFRRPGSPDRTTTPPADCSVPIDPDEERSANPIYGMLKDIHARWLMTPRADLREETPRDIMLTERDHLSEDMQQRCDQWARTQECPRGLDATSHAFRFGGFGTHELVKYYDLIRELLWSCWGQLTECDQFEEPESPESFCLADFLTGEVPRLEQVRDEWLDTPDPECHLRTPRSIIDRERARLPEALFGREAMIDPDCPCCQMLAELPGPTFLHLDGSAMDWEFPFDIYCRTREEWDAEQVEYSEFSQSADDPGPPFEVSTAECGSNRPISVWSRSFSMAESTDLPLGVRLLGIAWHIAELVMELNELTDAQTFIDQLNRDFRNLREVISDAEESRVESLVDPVIERFEQTLQDIAEGHPELEARCCDLARKVKSFREPPAQVSS